MFGLDAVRRNVGRSEVAVVGLCALSLAALPFASLAWIIAVDSLRWDAVVPSVAFTALLPGLTVALVPAAAARYVYDTATALRVGVAVSVVGATAIASACWASNTYMVC